VNSIGDFAESLILGQVEDIKQGKSLPPKLQEAKTTANAPAKDISNVEVPDDMMRQILSEGFHTQNTPPSEAMPELVWDEPQEEVSAPEVITEDTGKALISLLEEVKGMLSDLKEMTTAGMIGVNLGGPCKDPMKGSAKGYITPLSAKPVNNRKAILKQSIKRRFR
jgi:hypothetical protein